jgi:hypothetical protein
MSKNYMKLLALLLKFLRGDITEDRFYRLQAEIGYEDTDTVQEKIQHAIDHLEKLGEA